MQSTRLENRSRADGSVKIAAGSQCEGRRPWTPTSVLASASRVSVFGNTEMIPDTKGMPLLSFTCSGCPSPDWVWDSLRSQKFSDQAGGSFQGPVLSSLKGTLASRLGCLHACSFPASPALAVRGKWMWSHNRDVCSAQRGVQRKQSPSLLVPAVDRDQ